MSSSITNRKASVSTLAFLLLLVFSASLQASNLISIIIDDIGYEFQSGKNALLLDGNVTYALLPNTPFSEQLAKLGQQRHKEFMLHLPMQSVDSRLFTADSLHLHMSNHEFETQLTSLITQYPFVKGVNNHMGSLLTLHPGFMQQLMRNLKQLGNLYFVDSKTTAKSIALQFARENRVPSIKRDIFLDNIQTKQHIHSQFDKLIQLSKKQGYAVAIGHPYPETTAVLNERIKSLQTNNIQLVTISALLQRLEEQFHDKSTDTLSAGLRGTRSDHSD